MFYAHSVCLEMWLRQLVSLNAASVKETINLMLYFAPSLLNPHDAPVLIDKEIFTSFVNQKYSEISKRSPVFNFEKIIDVLQTIFWILRPAFCFSS